MAECRGEVKGFDLGMSFGDVMGELTGPDVSRLLEDAELAVLEPVAFELLAFEQAPSELDVLELAALELAAFKLSTGRGSMLMLKRFWNRRSTFDVTQEK